MSTLSQIGLHCTCSLLRHFPSQHVQVAKEILDFMYKQILASYKQQLKVKHHFQRKAQGVFRVNPPPLLCLCCPASCLHCLLICLALMSLLHVLHIYFCFHFSQPKVYKLSICNSSIIHCKISPDAYFIATADSDRNLR